MSASFGPSVLACKDPNAKPNVKPILVPAHLEANRPSEHSSAGNPRTRPIIISIEAAIGTGKSSLLRLLQRTIGASGKWVVVQEPVEQWQAVGGKHNLLEAYYASQERFAFSFQTNCVLSRIRSLQDVLRSTPAEVEVIVLERCWQSDRNTFGEMLRRQKKISELEWALYEEWYQFAVENAPFVDGHVYLQANADVCMQRLRKRDRTEEVGVTEAYQQELIACHEAWLNGLVEQDRVCRVDVAGEFISDADNANRVVTMIESFISQLRTLRAQC